MAIVIANMSMSLDGFIADPDDGVDLLFEWYSAGPVAVDTANEDIAINVSEADAEALSDFGELGAVVGGRRLFEIAQGWGGKHPTGAPVFIVTHAPPEDWSHGGITFVTDGVESAVAQAKSVAGDGTVAVASANVTQQCLDAGLIDVISVDLIPVLLGAGIPFFANLRSAPVRLSDPEVHRGNRVTHLRYRVLGPAAG
ncbi:dihydrofolate reductase family protein [Aldersonia sp. NBC_00410]|uniref:dihydrofolate reductase family protein n=1 Tax=Aldersonia sp. NBC_00410 TaxID=2975954 RepID=UPI00224D303E|nr:dihydrofolate reductase family protein [Aldersonia sp. NBC_00410]MCX5042205.1 dihydrofolate reductase family protein [Aldersonia sp. NBC_00410]